MKKFITITRDENGKVMLSKDIGMIPYAISKHFEEWESYLAYLTTENQTIEDAKFEEYCKLIPIGTLSGNNHVDRKTISEFIKHQIKNYDVVNFYNYGSSVYRWAYLCKKYNPNIIVYSKLDMSSSGYNHFTKGGLLRKIKNLYEKILSRYIDFFSVESTAYYEILKTNIMFSKRLEYIPNGVALIDNLPVCKKDNIILHVAKLGNYDKNSEVLLISLQKISKNIIENWKVYLIGSYTKEFYMFLEKIYTESPHLKNIVMLIGEITDRHKLYEYYSKSKIFCLASRTESFGIVSIEALFFNNYLLLSNYGPVVNDIIPDDKIGKIIYNNVPAMWSEELTEAMQKNLDYMTDENIGRRYIEKNFNYDLIAKKIISKISAI